MGDTFDPGNIWEWPVSDLPPLTPEEEAAIERYAQTWEQETREQVRAERRAREEFRG